MAAADLAPGPAWEACRSGKCTGARQSKEDSPPSHLPAAQHCMTAVNEKIRRLMILVDEPAAGKQQCDAPPACKQRLTKQNDDLLAAQLSQACVTSAWRSWPDDHWAGSKLGHVSGTGSKARQASQGFASAPG